ncbi:hypothetical protein CMO96_04395 [Candidatus Woesebacteria bacterium]|nr:hypothetical protein [Candidatus Woesebacteria bacterium]
MGTITHKKNYAKKSLECGFVTILYLSYTATLAESELMLFAEDMKSVTGLDIKEWRIPFVGY